MTADPPAGAARLRLVGALGITQILSWGCSYYLLAVLATPISEDTGWTTTLIVGGFSWGMLAAGLVSPWMGRRVDRHGGRSVLAASSILLALGLTLIGLAPGLALYYLGWTVMGAGMACGLYDAAFATLGRLLGKDAKPSLTGVTLLGGLASTLSWPAIAALEQWFGWRQACLVLAATQLAVSLPIHLLLVPDTRKRGGMDRPATPLGHIAPTAMPNDRLFLLVAAIFTLQAFVTVSLSVHLLEVLRQLGMATATALAIGMLIGPSQVGARLLEFTVGRNLAPTWSARIAMTLLLIGTLCLLTGKPWVAFAAIVLYGAGNGIQTIAKGTLPLALFGVEGYGARMGLLARPILLAQACGPLLAAFFLEAVGPVGLLLALGLALLLAALGAWLLPMAPRTVSP
ncbi:MFS transporter [Stutzerimonas azotifigens]|uniref:MFS transporter n=1 Tax=Stutzerimonas azotifigens TaxID=291995 RepID=UPI000410D3AD|nr:MFS transporter [Stutzerimonas azotifigens]